MMKNQKKIRDDEKNDKKGVVPFSRAPNNNRDVDEEKNRLEKIKIFVFYIGNFLCSNFYNHSKIIIIIIIFINNLLNYVKLLF